MEVHRPFPCCVWSTILAYTIASYPLIFINKGIARKFWNFEAPEIVSEAL